MLRLEDIRQYIAGLGIAEHTYIGKLDNKKQKSIGVYQRPGTGTPHIALGGYDCTTYDIRPISLLIHWTREPMETEEVAYQLFEHLKQESSLTIGNTFIHCILLQVPEPQSVGTDDSGVYEYVIWLDFIYSNMERKVKYGRRQGVPGTQ